MNQPMIVKSTVPYLNIAFIGYGWYLTISNEGACLTFKSIFHKALDVFEFDWEITLNSVPGTNQY